VCAGALVACGGCAPWTLAAAVCQRIDSKAPVLARDAQIQRGKSPRRCWKLYVSAPNLTGSGERDRWSDALFVAEWTRDVCPDILHSGC